MALHRLAGSAGGAVGLLLRLGDRVFHRQPHPPEKTRQRGEQKGLAGAEDRRPV